MWWAANEPVRARDRWTAAFERGQEWRRIEPQVVRIRPQEPPDVHRRRERIEPLRLERFQEARRNAGILSRLLDAQPALDACVAESGANLGHGCPVA